MSPSACHSNFSHLREQARATTLRLATRAVLAFSVWILLAACGSRVTTDTTKPAPSNSRIEVSSYSVSISPTSTKSLTGTVIGAGFAEAITWTSSAPNVATITDDGPFGDINAISEGTTTVYAMLKSNHSVKSPAVTVTVVRAPALSAFTADSTIQQLIVGDSKTVQLNPTKAESRVAVTYAYTSNNPSVATIGAITGVLTAVSGGTTTISVTATGSGVGLRTNSLTASAQVAIGVVQAGGKRIGGGFANTCALKTNGQAYCWGWNLAGQLGDGTFVDHTTPTAVVGNLTFSEISVGYQHTCGIATGGVAYCWGYGGQGRIGNGLLVNRDSPTLVRTAQTFSTIDAGGTTTCALTAVGAAYCWGFNMSFSAAGRDSTDQTTPSLVPLPVTFKVIAGGYANSCGVSTAKTIYCFTHPPELQESDSVYAALDGGRLGKCALSVRGQLACWGGMFETNLPGQPKDSFTRPFVTGFVFKSVVVGADHGCALTVAGIAYCWGFGASGQLGNGSASNRSALTAVSGNLTFVELAAGDSHTCGITTGNQLYCWGRNSNGQLGVPGGAALVPQLVPFTP